jgi:hypothetical protein
VIVLFVAGFLCSIAFIANPAKQAAVNAGMTVYRARKIQLGVFGFYILYLMYASILALQGVFAINAIPPRVFAFTTIPLTIILFGIAGNTGLFKKLLRSARLESLIALHVFRLLGVFFIILYSYRLLHPGFAFSAGIVDIITALLALPVAKWVSEGKPWSQRAAYVWNILGALDIVILLVIATMTAIKSITGGEPGDLEMMMFPFVWFPAFAPATILFLHSTVFRKLIQIKKTNIVIGSSIAMNSIIPPSSLKDISFAESNEP